MTDMPGLYFGPPTEQDYCAYQYMKGGVPRPELRCPAHIDFDVKIQEGRGDDWRKAWASCFDHLPDLIWQMQLAHGGYTGEFLVRESENPLLVKGRENA